MIESKSMIEPLYLSTCDELNYFRPLTGACRGQRAASSRRRPEDAERQRSSTDLITHWSRIRLGKTLSQQEPIRKCCSGFATKLCTKFSKRQSIRFVFQPISILNFSRRVKKLQKSDTSPSFFTPSSSGRARPLPRQHRVWRRAFHPRPFREPWLPIGGLWWRPTSPAFWLAEAGQMPKSARKWALAGVGISMGRSQGSACVV